MDVGAHRKKAYHNPPSPDEEQWKRAFWFVSLRRNKRLLWFTNYARRILVIMDRWLSAELGRSCSIQEEECVQYMPCTWQVLKEVCSFDLDLPIDVDDEYWEHSDSALAFKQPAGKPSRISFFIGSIKLSKVLGVALRSIVRTTGVCFVFICSYNDGSSP